MDVLARIVRRFDLVAIQELRTTDTSVMPSFLRLINHTGGRYEIPGGKTMLSCLVI